MTLRVTSWAAGFAILVALGTPAPARAQATDPAGAESLFDEGRKLMDAGKFEQACPKLEASNKLEPAVGTLLNLGECNEKRGKLASAWSNYRAAASLASSRSDARADFAKKRADGLSNKLSTLTIEVPSPEPGLKVTRDGLEVSEGAWGTAIPIDAGAHTIEAKAPGKRTNTVKVNVAEGSPSQNVVKLEPLAADSSAPAPAPPVTPPPKPEPPPNAGGEDHTGTIVGAIGVGVGVVGITVGSILAFKAKGKWNDAKAAHCNDQNLCDDTGVQLNSDARTEGTIATVLFTAGIVVAVAGVAAIVFWPKSEPPKASALRLHGAGFDF